MINKMKTVAFLLGVFIAIPAISQEKTQVYLGAEFVSRNIWRGLDYGGMSVLPSISIVGNSFSLSTYGSAGFDTDDTKTIGFTFGYQLKGLKISVTDFWYSDFYTFEGKVPNTFFNYNSHTTSHVFEAGLEYDFGFMAIEWNTIFAGYDYYKAAEERAYSSYIELSAP